MILMFTAFLTAALSTGQHTPPMKLKFLNFSLFKRQSIISNFGGSPWSPLVIVLLPIKEVWFWGNLVLPLQLRSYRQNLLMSFCEKNYTCYEYLLKKSHYPSDPPNVGISALDISKYFLYALIKESVCKFILFTKSPNFKTNNFKWVISHLVSL